MQNTRMKEPLGIDKLMDELNHLNEETQRLKRSKIESLVRQMVNEIPYAHQIIPNTLTESLLADAPHKPDDITINSVIANLGLSLFDVRQKNELIALVQAYLTQRRKTEQSYAESLLPDILKHVNLDAFPEKARPELVHIAQTILEKVINEKQLRKSPGYRLESLITLVEPIIYHRLFNQELDRLRITHHLPFRKFVNDIAHYGYEKINDDAKLTIIQNEKNLAFSQFSHGIAQKAVVYPPLEHEHAKLRFLQKDKISKSIELQKILDGFLQTRQAKTVDGELTQHLRIRFTEKLRRNLHHVELRPEIYQDEFTLKQAHDAVFRDVKDDVYAIKYLISKVKSIRENYHKNFLHVFAQRSALNAIDAILLDTILGKTVVKTDLITSEKHTVRENGYPKAGIHFIYTTVIAQLTTLQHGLTGLFANLLREDIMRVCAELQKIALKFTAPVSAQEEMSEPEVELPKAELPVEPRQAVVEPEPMPEPEPAPAPEPEPEPVTLEKITPPPFILPEEPEEEAVVQLEPVKHKEEPQEEPSEKMAPPPLQIEEESEPSTETLDAGAMIMKNYALGDFEKPIYAAWKKMTTHAEGDQSDATSGLINAASDNDVRMYVICDLAQQLTAIDVARLSDEQKDILQGIKNRILQALEDPLIETNWDYFEGTQRDIIDGQMGALG